jgi:DNA replicative helicase MCM subunit Mcm2 (Cdc46/Mcm family)
MARTGGNMAQDHFGETVRDKFFEFLETFTTANAAYSMSQASGGTAAEEAQQQFYVEQLKAMRESEKTTLYVDWQHLVSVDADLADELELQYLRIDPFLRKVSPLDQHSETCCTSMSSPPPMLAAFTPVPPCSFLALA